MVSKLWRVDFLCLLQLNSVCADFRGSRYSPWGYSLLWRRCPWWFRRGWGMSLLWRGCWRQSRVLMRPFWPLIQLILFSRWRYMSVFGILMVWLVIISSRRLPSGLLFFLFPGELITQGILGYQIFKHKCCNKAKQTREWKLGPIRALSHCVKYCSRSGPSYSEEYENIGDLLK